MTERESELIGTVRLEIMAGIAGDLPRRRELRISEEPLTKCEKLQSRFVKLSKEINWERLKCCELSSIKYRSRSRLRCRCDFLGACE
jgi:hypothetical protein